EVAATPADETRCTFAPRRQRGRPLLGAKSPFLSWTRSPTSTPNCGRSRASDGEYAIETSKTGTPRRRTFLSRSVRGNSVSEMWWPRRAQGAGDCLPACRDRWWQSEAGSAVVLDDDERPTRAQ